MQYVSPLLIPNEWCFIKTRGKSEGNALYTRGTCVIIPQYQVDLLFRSPKTTDFVELMIHEAFHICSRYNPELRDKLYSCIGFQPLSGPVILGNYLMERKITNPDCPDFLHYITIKNDKNEEFPAILVDYANTNKYVVGREITSYIKTSLFKVCENNTGEKSTWSIVDYDQPEAIDLDNNQSFSEKTGTNTFYQNHPEEIMADNVSILVMGCGNYDLSEIDDLGFVVLEKIAMVFGNKVLEKIRQARKKQKNVSRRQRKHLKTEATFHGRRKRRKLDT
eukprot:TRINITY_DN4985_c0_g1_i1.p1 TRINITY_DN4985_c0_g1~~TRINITY_DN4985_c0_g1_i1.p1  ORF type:complete len:278 (+),score=39.23 TRINITY_DN4985_c0_g1_i1:426-1259(+)